MEQAKSPKSPSILKFFKKVSAAATCTEPISKSEDKTRSSNANVAQIGDGNEEPTTNQVVISSGDGGASTPEEAEAEKERVAEVSRTVVEAHEPTAGDSSQGASPNHHHVDGDDDDEDIPAASAGGVGGALRGRKRLRRPTLFEDDEECDNLNDTGGKGTGGIGGSPAGRQKKKKKVYKDDGDDEDDDAEDSAANGLKSSATSSNASCQPNDFDVKAQSQPLTPSPAKAKRRLMKSASPPPDSMEEDAPFGASPPSGSTSDEIQSSQLDDLKMQPGEQLAVMGASAPVDVMSGDTAVRKDAEGEENTDTRASNCVDVDVVAERGLKTECSAARTEQESACRQVQNLVKSGRFAGDPSVQAVRRQNPGNKDENVKASLLQSLIGQTSLYFQQYLENFYFWASARPDLSFPQWLNPTRIRDKNGRRPTDSLYDVSSIAVPKANSSEAKSESRHFTPAMESFWEIKKDNFDKILLFKLGKFYELFYIDACIGHRVCGLKWMGGDGKPHVGFPESGIHTHAQSLVNAGYRVTVVEQMETPKELQERNKASSGPKRKTIHREVCEVFTRGTLMHSEMLKTTEARHLLVLNFETSSSTMICETPAEPQKDTHSFGFAYVDTATSLFGVGHLEDSPARLNFQTLLAQLTPVEVVYDPQNIPPAILKYLKRLPNAPLLSSISTNDGCPDADHPSTPEEECRQWFSLSERDGTGNEDSRMSETNGDGSPANSENASKREARTPKEGDREDEKARQRAWDLCLQRSCVMRAFICAARYLKAVLVDKQVLTFARFEVYEARHSSKLELNSTALENLEIFTNQEGTTSSTLFEFLNRTQTGFGSRVLRRWVASPLCDDKLINARLDVVDWFLKRPALTGDLQSRLKLLPDLERLLSRTCAQALRSERGAVYFAFLPHKKLQQLMELMDNFDGLQKIFSLVEKEGKNNTDDDMNDIDATEQISESCRSVEDPSKLQLPELLKGMIARLKVVKVPEAIADIKSRVCYDNGSQSWRPAEGADEGFDRIVSEIAVIRQDAENEIPQLSQELNIPKSSLKLVDAKFKFEIEVPDDLMTKTKKNLVDVTSSRKGFLRFQTDAIKEYVSRLEDKEQELQDQIYPFLSSLLKFFHVNHHRGFSTAVQVGAELDALLSLALVSEQSATGPMCRPELLPATARIAAGSGAKKSNGDDGGEGTIEQQEGSEPFIELRECRHPIIASLIGNFISNDIVINRASVEGGTLLLVTGPNMGGKSTTLRQVCVTAIMAQLGCYVPARECRMTCVDKIFTRVGAKDSILEGKSTFLVELEETSAMLRQATRDSLCILDELGRGTSTFDGSAIALATAEHLAKKIRCRSLFATHYHILSNELSSEPAVRNVHMAARVDEERETVTFLYKLSPSSCPKSHGLIVARLAGLPDKIIQVATVRSKEFEQTAEKFRAGSSPPSA